MCNVAIAAKPRTANIDIDLDSLITELITEIDLDALIMIV
jgi:hypothetical protein